MDLAITIASFIGMSIGLFFLGWFGMALIRSVIEDRRRCPECRGVGQWCEYDGTPLEVCYECFVCKGTGKRRNYPS